MAKLYIGLLFVLASGELASQSGELVSANPIRKVVTMLQMMAKKVEAEGKKQDELFEKFFCYCDTGAVTLGKSIEDANTKIPQLESDIKEATELKAQLEADLAKHQTDRE